MRIWATLRKNRGTSRAIAITNYLIVPARFSFLIFVRPRPHFGEAGEGEADEMVDHCWGVFGMQAESGKHSTERAAIKDQQHQARGDHAYAAASDGWVFRRQIHQFADDAL